MSTLPYLSADQPGIGGVIRQRVEDFSVEEIPAYQPGGEGDHVYCWIEKREITTFDAVAALARALAIKTSDIGTAGMKDKWAVTQQFISLPPPVAPQQALAIEIPGLVVHSAVRHNNKLRTGHLKGNRFRIVIRSLAIPIAEAMAVSTAVLDLLSRAPGSPNWFGPQRFGRRGDNHERGLGVLRGTVRERGKKKRLMISALQSKLFNDYLVARIEDGLYAKVLDGDILQVPSGATFDSENPAIEQGRLDSGELLITGPMFGHKSRQPAADSTARAREQAILDSAELATEDFRPLGKLAFGTRRALSVQLGTTTANEIEGEGIELCFDLPAGAYATSVLREVMKNDDTPGENHS